MSQTIQAMLAKLRETGQLDPAVAARELALLEDGPGPQQERSGADLFLTGAALPPTAPVGQHAQAVVAGARLAPGQRLLERYEVLALLGVGGMGQVYLVQDQRRGREIAIKVLYPSGQDDGNSWPPAGLVQRLRHELAINERLTHPKVLRTYDLETDPDVRLLFFTMEYIAGESLAQRLQRHDQLPVEMCLQLLQQIADALDYAHQQGVIHRDVKPSNVLVTAGDAIKLLDFGIALDGAQPQGPVMGTAYYMAPEQLRGEEVSAAADIYALGVLAFQMLTGHLPQPGMPGPSTLCKDAGLAGLSAARLDALDAAVLKAMHWRPRQRFGAAGELVHALAEVFATSQTPTAPTPRQTAASTAAPTSAPSGAEATPNNVVPLAQENASGRRSPKAIERLHQRIGRKRPGWLDGAPAAPHSVSGHGSISLPPSQWALSQLPPVPSGQQERILLSRQGVPLASFVYVPPGTCEVGLPADDPEAMPAETPSRQISLDGFWIARTPITNAAWSVFLQESGYEPPSAYRRSYYLRHWPEGPSQPCPQALRDHPVVWVSYPVVWAFCDFYGLSLPSEIQWERGIRGGPQRYPWGDELPSGSLSDVCNAGNKRGGVCPVGSYPDGSSSFGVLGGIGNVLEWCADRWRPGLYSSLGDAASDDPISPPGKVVDRVVVRGGHYYTEPSRLRATYRQGCPLMQSTAHTGFRPVLDWRK